MAFQELASMLTPPDPGSNSPIQPGLVSMTDSASRVSLMETRLEELDKKYSELLERVNQKKEEDAASRSKDQAKRSEKGDAKDTGDPAKLIPELNRMSWVEWRKLKVAEETFDSKSDDQKKKENEKRGKSVKKHVIDVVADTGDLGCYPGLDTRQEEGKNQWVPCRIRINSEHIIDALNDITNVPLPQPCQLLHPFKPIMDYIDPIRLHATKLEDELTEAKAFSDTERQIDTRQQTTATHNKATNSAVELQEKGTERASRPDPGDHSQTAREDAIALAEERCAHYRVLLDLLDTNLAQEIRIAQSIRDGTAQKIRFCHLWYLFPPGETIYFLDPNRAEPAQVTLVLKTSGGRAKLPNAAPNEKFLGIEMNLRRFKYSSFTIDTFYLDYDGEKFRPVQTRYEISRYNTEVPIVSLMVFPLRFLQEPTRAIITESLLKRGENFRSLTTVEAAHREFRGMSLGAEREEIDGRVIIDFKSSPSAPLGTFSGRSKGSDDDKNENARNFGLRAMSQTDDVEVMEVYGRNRESPEPTLYNDHLYDCEKTDRLFLSHRVLLTPSHELSADNLTNEDMCLLPGTVYAYVLRSRNYCKCDISLIKDIDLSKTAFDDLVLPDSYRGVLKSLVERHSHGSSPVEQTAGEKSREGPGLTEPLNQHSPDGRLHQDTLSIVKGKGRGLIILLHGVPGVGKSSTAETIADATGRPLLPVTCGDIGENASEVEKSLEHIFTNSHRWGCVLLLDEAEVFLVKRNNEDLKRNAMVSVFLRMLEYYSGILFLTTNRVGTIDEAFKSRIHVCLYYPPLNWKTSKEIWRVNLKRSQDKVDADQEQILRFAKKHFFKNDEGSRWNGRQIYNAFRTAIALARVETPDRDIGQKPRLLPSHFKQVAGVSRKFDEYLLSTQGGETFSSINQQQKVRSDRFGKDDVPTPLVRRPTKTRKLDMDELPSTSEDEAGDESSSVSSSEGSLSLEDRRAAKKKSKSSGRKTGGKSSRKSKKSTRHESMSSDSSS